MKRFVFEFYIFGTFAGLSFVRARVDNHSIAKATLQGYWLCEIVDETYKQNKCARLEFGVVFLQHTTSLN